MSLPPPGFYDDPQLPGRLRWWDGEQWTDHTQRASAAGSPDPGPVSSVSDLLQLPGRAVDWARENPESAQQIASAGVIADGLVGFGPGRQGILQALRGVLSGVVVTVVALFAYQWVVDVEGTIASPVQTQATVVSISRGADADGGSVCSATVEFTAGAELVRTTTAYSSNLLCRLREGEVRTITYDGNNPYVFEGLDPVGDRIFRYFALLFAGLGVFLACSSAWTFVLRATQIGAGTAFFVRARRKRAEKDAARVARRGAR